MQRYRYVSRPQNVRWWTCQRWHRPFLNSGKEILTWKRDLKDSSRNIRRLKNLQNYTSNLSNLDAFQASHTSSRYYSNKVKYTTSQKFGCTGFFFVFTTCYTLDTQCRHKEKMHDQDMLIRVSKEKKILCYIYILNRRWLF